MPFKTLVAASILFVSSAAYSSANGFDNSTRLPGIGVEVTQDRFIPVPHTDVVKGSVILLAQAESSQQLDEQIRLLNGKVEELTFQILQMQEQVRKMQEDNEFRFQELEKSKQGSVKQKPEKSDVAVVPAEPQAGDPVGDAIAGDQNAEVPTADPSLGNSPLVVTKSGKQPKNLGTVTFDANGNPVSDTIAEAPSGTTDTASLGDQSNPGELYKTAYDHVLAGEYSEAESGFRLHIEKFPADPQTADARYWLGESLASQDRHREAAEVLLAAQKAFPKSKKAPDMLFKLGVSLAALDNKDVACATFAQVLKKYPKAGPALLGRVSEEQAKAGC